MRMPAGGRCKRSYQTPVQTLPPQPPSEVRRPATPALERLRQRLKTISRDQRENQAAIKESIAKKKKAEKDIAAKKANPLFLNRIVNSIGELLGIGGSDGKKEQEDPDKADAKGDQSLAAASRPGAREAPPAPKLNPFNPRAIPSDARLPDAFAPLPPKRSPVPPVNIAPLMRARRLPKRRRPGGASRPGAASAAAAKRRPTWPNP